MHPPPALRELGWGMDPHLQQLAIVTALLEELQGYSLPVHMQAACLQMALVQLLADAGYDGDQICTMLAGAAELARVQVEGVPLTGGGPEGDA